MLEFKERENKRIYECKIVLNQGGERSFKTTGVFEAVREARLESTKSGGLKLYVEKSLVWENNINNVKFVYTDRF